jgi:hypothetical protein
MILDSLQLVPHLLFKKRVQHNRGSAGIFHALDAIHFIG